MNIKIGLLVDLYPIFLIIFVIRSPLFIYVLIRLRPDPEKKYRWVIIALGNNLRETLAHNRCLVVDILVLLLVALDQLELVAQAPGHNIRPTQLVWASRFLLFQQIIFLFVENSVIYVARFHYYH